MYISIGGLTFSKIMETEEFRIVTTLSMSSVYGFVFRVMIIESELYKIATDSNVHTIRSYRNTDCPSGKPDVMY